MIQSRDREDDQMTYRAFIKLSPLVLATVCLTFFLAATAMGESYYLKAGIKVIPPHTFNNPKLITMWGFAKCSDATFSICSSAQVPGPTLTATAGTALNITVQNHLNDLTDPVRLQYPLQFMYYEPVSIIVPGLIKQMAPRWMIPPVKRSAPTWPGAPTADGSRPAAGNAANQNDPAYSYRVRSFDTETPPDNITTTTYTWTGANVKEGTYLYQSGTHPSVQVQMGLYGTLIVYPGSGQVFGAPGTAYAAPATPGGNAARPAVHYDTEAVLLFSEIDPALHDAVTTGHFGANPSTVNVQANWMTSTANYTPRYFMVNGAPYSANSPVIPAGTFGQTVLLRFLNAGLATKVPTIQDTYNLIMSPPTPLATPANPQANLPYMTILAEDGYPVPWLKEEYSLLLTAGKTMDALITTASSVSTGAKGANIAVYDRRLNLTNSPLSPGGQFAYLHVGSAPVVNVIPDVVNFGDVKLFSLAQYMVTIKNNGLIPLMVTNAAPSGPNAAEFQTNTSAALGTIAPGQSTTITVYFKPTSAGPKSATLHIVTSDANQPTIDIPLYAVGS
jgi:FtsP/CotA-like multicopper oxidase with cupredoxin domain